jgi:hypothetical protein
VHTFGLIAHEPSAVSTLTVLLLLGLVGLIVAGACRLHHLSAYTLATQGAAVTDTDTPAVTDPAVTITNGHPIFPQPVQAYWAYGFGDTNITRWKLTTPKLRAINVVNLRPLDISATISSRPPIVEYFHHPISLNPLDENQLLVTTGAATAAAIWAFVAFGDGQFNVPQGDMFAVHASQSITLVSGKWASVGIALDQPLPAGRYSVIGAEAYGTNMLAFRLIFPNQVWRPGSIAGTTNGYINSRYFRWGNLGEWGQFESALLPSIDGLGSAAGAQTIDLTMDLVRVR